MAGLVANDYPARHVGLPGTAVAQLTRMRVHGRALTERMPARVVEAVVAESVEVPLWERLTDLACPVLVVRGGRADAVVDDAVAARYRRALPGVEIATLPDRGHGLWHRDIPAYLRVLLPFLAAVDRAEQSA